MPALFALRVQIGHFARESAVEPVAKAREAVGNGGGGDTREREAEFAGLLFEARREGCVWCSEGTRCVLHSIIMSGTRRSGRPKSGATVARSAPSVGRRGRVESVPPTENE